MAGWQSRGEEGKVENGGPTAAAGAGSPVQSAVLDRCTRQPEPCRSEAAAERIDRGYLGRTLQLTLLSPDIVEAILDGRQPADLGLPRLLGRVSADWSGQRQALLGTGAVG